MLLLALSFKKQCCDKVLGIVVRVLFTKTKKNFKKQSRNRYSQENCIGIAYGQEPIKFYGLLLWSIFLTTKSLILCLDSKRHLKLKIVRTSSQQNRYKGVIIYIKATPVLGDNLHCECF